MNTLKNDCNEILFNSTKYNYLKEYYNVDEIDRANAFKVLFNDCLLSEYRKTRNEIYNAYNNLYNKIKDCGDKNIDHIYWCGSILDTDNINVMNGFTPTIVQVAAGVLSGLSYIMESKNSNLGLIYSSKLDTNYILQKAVPLLGRFFFQEIPRNLFDKTLKITTKQIIK